MLVPNKGKTLLFKRDSRKDLFYNIRIKQLFSTLRKIQSICSYNIL